MWREVIKESETHIMLVPNRQSFVRSTEVEVDTVTAGQTFVAGGSDARHDTPIESEKPQVARKTIFARFMEALHFSRQCDARRLIRRFQHLKADSDGQSERWPPETR
jgi:hypothetical protein